MTKHFTFTPINLQKKAKPIEGKQMSYWDSGTKGQSDCHCW